MRFLGPTARRTSSRVASWAWWSCWPPGWTPLGYFSVAELKALDSQFDLRGPLPVSSPMVIVSVDEGSNDELELLWPRAVHAEFLDIVSRGRPAAIGRDILFAEPSGRGPADDAALAAGIKRAGNVVLAAALTVIREPGFDTEDLNHTALDDGNPTRSAASPSP